MRRITTIILMLFSMHICLAENYTNSNLSVTNIDKSFKITMPENKSTGYQWYLKSYDSKLITPSRKTYIAADTNIAGATGQAIWEFAIHNVRVPTITKLEFISQRSWQPEENTQSSSYTIFINSSG